MSRKPKVSRGLTLSDPEAAAKLEAALQASGLQPGELLTLLATARGAKAPTVAGTIGDMAADLFKKLDAVAQKPEFFARLTEYQQGALVAHLSSKGFRWVDIASHLGIPMGEVKRMVDEFSRQLGNSIMSQSLQAIVGELAIRHAERYAMAMADGDYKAALAEDQAWVKTMLDMGVSERAVQRHEITHKSDDIQAEIRRMLELERKKEFRAKAIGELDRKMEETTQAGTEESE